MEKSETETRIIQRRGIWTIKKIVKGEKFSRTNIDVLRPTLGIPASEYTSVIGKMAKRNFDSYEPVTNKDV